MPNSVIQDEPRNAKVQARVPEEIKRRWQTAAVMRGQTLTDFMIVAINKETAETLLENERIVLSERDQIKLAEMLTRPPMVNERLHKVISEELKQMKNY